MCCVTICVIYEYLVHLEVVVRVSYTFFHISAELLYTTRKMHFMEPWRAEGPVNMNCKQEYVCHPRSDTWKLWAECEEMIQTHRQHGDRIRLFVFFFFQNKECRLKRDVFDIGTQVDKLI
jgi:hypothetical protein